jgi:uncharacterized protein
MKLNEGRPGTANIIRSYGADGVTIGAARHALPLLVAATAVDTTLAAGAIEQLSAQDVERILALEPNIVLVGTLGGTRLAPAALRHRFESRRVALDCMELGAACRTYNVLVQEERAVVALLFS